MIISFFTYLCAINKMHYLEMRKSVKIDLITSFDCVYMELNTLVHKL